MTDEIDNKDHILSLGLNDKYTGIENRIVSLNSQIPDVDQVKITGTFLYFKFKGVEPTISEFVDFIYPKIIPFCIPKKKRGELGKKFSDTNDPRYILELTDQAKNLFIRAKKTLKRGGEPGELILFSALEYYLGAPQIASKMFLKTSESMPVHGTDGIHIKYDQDSNKLCLYWGESKLYQQLSKSLDEICDSLSAFIDRKDGRSPRDRDIDVLKDHTTIEDKAAKEAVLEYFDPYSEMSNDLREIYCCLSGFDYSIYGTLTDKGEGEIEEYFESKYLERIESACTLFSEKIKNSGIENLSFHFILLPFKSVHEFRKLFFAKLGVDLEDIEGSKNDD